VVLVSELTLLDLVQNESMVEIKQAHSESIPSSTFSDTDSNESHRYRLIYSKSKTYIHPTGA
jgi:hypothetical protein